MIKIVIFFAVLFSFSAISNPLLPGLFQSLEKIIALDNNESSNWNTPANTTEIQLLEKSRTGTIFYLAPEFLQTILFNATAQQLAIIGSNPCAITDYAWLNQLKQAKGKITSVPLLYSPGKASFSTIWVSRETWAKYLMSSTCKKSEEVAYLFSSKNLHQTLAQFTMTFPKDESTCHKQLDDVLKNEKTPYYCYLYDAAKKGDVSLEMLKSNTINSDFQSIDKKKLVLQSLKVKELLGHEKFDYLKNTCENINNKEKYCSYFFTSDFWKKKIINSAFDNLLVPSCPNLSAAECSDKINRNNQYCLWSMLDYPGLLPRATCNESSTALNYSKLNINYRDCPGRINNSNITTAGRILMHFGYEKILFAKNKKIQPPEQVWNPNDICSSNTATAFLDFTYKIQWDDVWTAKICFDDKLQRKNLCAPFLLSNINNSAFSLTSTMSEILKKAKRMDKSYQCQTIDFKKYDNQLLKFKTGCWILIPTSGELTSSPIKVVIDDREQRDVIRVDGNVNFPIHSFQNSNQYHNFQYKIEKELGIKSQLIKTLPVLNSFMQKQQSIINGIGCLEELLPDFFPSTSINSCKPISFIVSGMIASKNLSEAALVVHTALDEIASPRLISWQQITASVEAYQKIHPQSQWSLYGLEI